MRAPQDLKEGYRKFRNGSYRKQADLFHALEKGQNPAVMIIACADSRAEPADIFSAAPGELFVVRNVANLVPSYEASEGLLSVGAALEFAVGALGVKHIVIMGHGGCGGVAASLAAADNEPTSKFIAPWVELLDEARSEVLEHQAGDPQTALERSGIGKSLENLMTFPFVAVAVEAGELELHGSWFAIGSGELHWRDSETGTFEPVEV